MARADSRSPGDLRLTRMTPHFQLHPEGSVLIDVGNTRVMCAASIEDRVPPFLRGQGKGWVTAEYGMLPRATTTRTQRESSSGKVGGRTQEIQRLIGRSLRSVVSMDKLGERTIWVDCDVIQADGGTRTASITGSCVAIALACRKLVEAKLIKEIPIRKLVAAVSVGVSGGEALLDLDYLEDKDATVDMNLVMTEDGQFVELQGSGEETTFSEAELATMLQVGRKGISELIALQRAALGIISPLG